MKDTFSALVAFLFAEDRRNHPIPADKVEVFLQKLRTHIRTLTKNKEEGRNDHG